MNENLNLVEILKDCPKGTKVYSPMLGEMEFIEIYPNSSYPIIAESKRHRCTPDFFTKEGKYIDDCDAECMLFPSKDNRDWSTFKVLNKLPKTWEEFCENNPVTENECWVTNIKYHKLIMNKEFKDTDTSPKNKTPLIYSHFDYTKRVELREKLEHIFNELEIDNIIGICDFILAEMVDNFLCVTYNTKKAMEDLGYHNVAENKR